MQSKATTVSEYLKELPADRRAAIEAIRKIVLKNLDKDFEEGMAYGMIGYYVPHRIYPPGYHCNPSLGVPFAGLASQKNHLSVYLMSVYAESPEEDWFRKAWAKTSKKLDMGKCCIRSKKLEDLALDVIGEAVRKVSAKSYIDNYVATLGRQSASKGAPRSRTSRRVAPKTSAAPARRKAATKRK